MLVVLRVVDVEQYLLKLFENVMGVHLVYLSMVLFL